MGLALSLLEMARRSWNCAAEGLCPKLCKCTAKGSCLMRSPLFGKFWFLKLVGKRSKQYSCLLCGSYGLCTIIAPVGLQAS